MERPSDRLDAAMERRRLDLGLNWSEVAASANVSVATLRAIRRGANHPNPLTQRGIEKALCWGRGSVQAILAGGDALPEAADRLADLNRRLEASSPEGALIDDALAGSGIPLEDAARRVHLVPEAWRAMTAGHEMVLGRRVSTHIPTVTLATMAEVLDVTPEELVRVGRADAADELRAMRYGGDDRDSSDADLATAIRLMNEALRLIERARPKRPDR